MSSTTKTASLSPRHSASPTQAPDARVRLTIRQLEVFSAVAREGSTRAGADHVARSQSAASTALAELEATLGVQLFDRVGKRLVLNENGRTLLPHAAALIEQAVEAQSLFSVTHAGLLRLASSYTVGEYLLPEIIARWRNDHPRNQLQLRIVNTHEVFEAVAGFSADLGFIEGQHSHPDLVVQKWGSDSMTIVAAPHHPLSKAPPSVHELSQASWVMRETGSGTREASDRWLIPQLDELRVDLELGSNEAVKRAVAQGVGIGCLSRLAVADALAQGWLIELPSSLPLFERGLSIVTHRSKPLGSISKMFLLHCLKNLPSSTD